MAAAVARCILLLLPRIIAGQALGEFTPQSVEYAQLVDDRLFAGTDIQRRFQSALEEIGLITVSAIPDYESLHQEMLEHAHLCARSLPEDIARGHIFTDGTKRITLAMSGRQGDLPLGEFDSCPGLQGRVNAFRQLVSKVAQAFFERLDSILDLQGSPLFSSLDTRGVYETTSDIFLHGEHLDHIHSYYKQSNRAADVDTMDLHTDQGLAIAFTPAIMLDEATPHSMAMPELLAGKFEIMSRNGKRIKVHFPDGHLVFMLGDGVNQYVNPKKIAGPDLFATPHAMTMPQHSSSQWRVWFGRMFLPPSDALHENGLTQTQLRNGLMEAWAENDADIVEPHLHMACSHGLQAQELRQLSTDPPCSSGARRRCSGNCANNQLQCWWRCMNFTELVGPDVCAAQGMGFNCTNRRDEISIGGVQHGDYNLACTNSTQLVRENCELEQINAVRSANANAAGFEAFLESQGNYDGRHDLQLDGNNDTEVAFLWAVDAGKVTGLLAFNGELSWISLGIENVGGPLRGMKGGEVLFGVSSKDQEFPDLVGVNEYKIDLAESRFRHWNIPYEGNNTADSMLIEENGYTALKFSTSTIYGKPLNVTGGSNRLMWAIRASTYMHIGKDSYHEGCKGEERIRYRGGGEDHPWIVDFSDTTSACCVGKMLEAENSGGGRKPLVLAAVLIFGSLQLAFF